jgi:hypothetical protein
MAMTQSECEERIKSLANTPTEVRRLADGLSLNETRWNPPGDEFSVVENVCHLRDIELDGYAVRINRILQEDQPFLTDLNGAKLAVDRAYNSQDLSSAMEAFTQARENNVRIIRELSSAQLERTGTLEDIGEITLRRLLDLMQEHDNVHLNELVNLRARLAHLI